MENNSNLQIIQRLLELGKNLPGYNEKNPSFPRHFKEERIWLANILNDSLSKKELEFNENFRRIIAEYKMNLSQGKGYGWFHNPESLEWDNVQLNQLKYIIYGKDFIREIKFKKSLGKKAYEDFIKQIDGTALMTPAQLTRHNKSVNKMSNDILNEILAESEKKK